MALKEIHPLGYSTATSEVDFARDGGQVFRLESLPLIPELLVPALVLVVTFLGLGSVAVYLCLLRDWPSLTTGFGVFAITVLLVMLTIGAIKQISKLSRGGNMPILLAVSPSCIRLFLPRETPQDMILDATSTLSVTVQRSGFALNCCWRYVLIIETRENLELIWGDLMMFYFWSRERDILQSLQKCFREARYNDYDTLLKPFKAASHSPAAKSLDTPEV